MKKINPFFEVNGNRFEIKPTRYILAEYDKMTRESNLDAEQKENVLKVQRLAEEAKKFAEQLAILQEKYFETFDDEDERKYKKCREMYEQIVEKMTHIEASTDCTKLAIDTSARLLEKIVILALAEQYFNFNNELAKQTWESYVESLPSHNVAIEWLNLMADSLFNDTETENEDDFFAQKRREAEQNAENRRKALKKKM
jgi:hypothetical protein